MPPTWLTTVECYAADVSEKKPLDHDSYDKWNSVGTGSLSHDGKWVSFTVRPAEGDATLTIRHIDSGKEFKILRGSNARFTPDNKLALFTVSPNSDEVKKAREQKKNPPPSKIEILDLASGESTTIQGASRFSMPEKSSDWVAFKLDKINNEESIKQSKSSLTQKYNVTEAGIELPESKKEFRKPKKTPSKSVGEKENKKPEQKKSEKKKEEATEQKPDSKELTEKLKKKTLGGTLVLRDLKTGLERRFPYVNQFRFNEMGTHLVFTSSTPKGESDGVTLINLKNTNSRSILSGAGDYGTPVFSKDGKSLVVLTNKDDYSSKQSAWALYGWKRGKKAAQKWVAFDDPGLPAGWWIASSSSPYFSEDGSRVYLRTRPRPEDTNDSKDKGEEKAKLDLWHWQDPYLQPQQLLRAQQERGRSYQAVFHVQEKKFAQLATKEINQVFVNPRFNTNHVLGVAPNEYRKMQSWDVQSFSDWYLIDITTGKAKLVAKTKRGNPSLSPHGKFITWWDGEQKTWFSMSTESGDVENPIDLGKAVGQPVHNELHDQPSLPGSYGTAGWLEDDAAILIYDRWDIWQVDPTGETEAVCLTNGMGREEEIRLRAVRLDPEAVYAKPDQEMYLSALYHQTKATGFFRRDPAASEEEKATLHKLIKLDERLGSLTKAKESDRVVFTRQTFNRYPDLWASTLKLDSVVRLSHVNPQQDEYRWGSAELVQWEATDGQELTGLLYKPEGFDPAKKYPMMVYFYERNSDNLHTYYSPAAGRSIINFSFYVSRGYVLFVPDITYKVGEPGPSAANAILPGVEHILEMGFVDKDRVGMQGHSWGGYQTAYLVTQTDMFACAESGAPVSNMTSAYGGIRWGSGMSRMFQYEKTQSRIGDTLWNARQKYIENSPVFFADKVNTPLLILHNDEDTAVPWYQGIELFVALRRLEKPAWMLNYNGDPHWVMGEANRIDFAKRMQQFFDHYLKGDPMPVWMAEGIPATQKGEEFGFEYIPEEVQEE